MKMLSESPGIFVCESEMMAVSKSQFARVNNFTDWRKSFTILHQISKFNAMNRLILLHSL